MAAILWRLANQATLDTLRGRSRGQYDIRLTRLDGAEEFFGGLERAMPTEHGGYTVNVPVEPAEGPLPVEHHTLGLRFMGPLSRRRDWYIRSQRPDTAYPLWRPGVGPLAGTEADSDYVALLRDDDARFHARWVRAAEAAALPPRIKSLLHNRPVGIADVAADDWDATAVLLGIALTSSVELAAGRRDEIILVTERFVATGNELSPDDLDDLADVVGLATASEDVPDVPTRVEEYLAALERVQAGDRDVRDDVLTVWREFAGDPQRLAAVAAAVRANLIIDPDVAVPPDVAITEAPEGRVLTAVHVRRERNRQLRASKITAAGGRPLCEVCGFDFEAVYGDRGQGFIECHHVVAIHELRPGAVTTLDDLALVCANCHRMIHARRPWLTVADLRAIVER